MPDFLESNPASGDMFGPSEESKKKKDAWFDGFPGKIDSQSKPFADVAKALKAEGYKSIGALGACWGYKVIVSSEGLGEISAIASAHPSFAATTDAENISIPLALFPSQGEDMDVMNKIHEAAEAKNPGKNVLKHFSAEVHGWTAARGDLKSPERAEAFRQAYMDYAAFFKQHL